MKQLVETPTPAQQTPMQTKPFVQWCKTRWTAICEGYHRMQVTRLHNQTQNRVMNAILTWLFPMFIVCLAELNQYVKIPDFVSFCINRTSVLLFDFLMAYLLFTAILLVTSRVWVAAWVQGLCYMTISVVELFKYSTNGNHFKLTDLVLAPNVKNLSSFAYVQITLPLVIYVLLLFLTLGVIFWQNPAFTTPWRKRVMPAVGCVAAYLAVVCVPGVSQSVYGVFDVDTSETENVFSTNEKFAKNSMLAFIVETTSEKLGELLREPEGYCEEQVADALTGTPTPAAANAVRPNVVVVMSESFADFRQLDALHLRTTAYDSFDAVASEGRKLSVAVPTFASYTVRTEFELLFGLPVRSLMDPITPQADIVGKTPSSLVSTYAQMGYGTAYVHPFTRTFYDRERIYGTFGFDTMLFDEDFTVPVTQYENGYISDETVFQQVEALLKESDQPMFIHTTTMQNHQPYDWLENGSELDTYLTGIRATGDALQRFTQALTASGEPTVLLFVGDHFPSMRGEGNLYDQLGMDSNNCSILYEQPALIWSNCPADALSTEQLPAADTMISTFYLNDLILQMIGAPLDAFTATILAQMQTQPVYTSLFLPQEMRNATLDLLTYDRIAGADYSGTRAKEMD